jgi:NADPH-dependent glutamate synthase beta subunit-like oxidoreductase
MLLDSSKRHEEAPAGHPSDRFSPLGALDMKICILGAGAVGTSFAVHLALAGHDVTLVARGARLDKLRRDGGVIATSPPTTPTPARARRQLHLPADDNYISPSLEA